MVKKFSALAAGITMLAMATIVPVMAQTTDSDSSSVNANVTDYITFAIVAGSSPFGSGSGTTLSPTSDDDFDISSSDEAGTDVTATYSQLQATTNSTNGYTVEAYSLNADSRTHVLLRSGGAGGTLADNIIDTVSRLVTAQGANDSTFDVITPATDRGVAFRLSDASTSAILREADEDTQWGATDDITDITPASDQALWAAPGIGSGAEEIVYDTTTYAAAATNAYIDWFVGVTNTQRAGDYSGTVTFTATANP
jgi:hypothetical protein